MFGEKNREVVISTLIGKAAKLTGNIVTKESIRIDGHVTGNITTEGIASITESAILDGDLKGSEIFISGVVRGNITAVRSLELEKTAVITGNIQTAKLQIHPGASFNGDTRMGDGIKKADEQKASNPKPPNLEE
jgi:cytoskeletal protein CcmA (bactofilin family)